MSRLQPQHVPLPAEGSVANSFSDQETSSPAFRDPTRAEIAGSASPTYVEYLVQLIDQRPALDEKILARLRELATEREHRQTALMHNLAQGEELRQLRQDVAEKTLQLQEARERCLRLQHENTVLHVQESEERDRVAALAELCRQRGLDGTAHSAGRATKATAFSGAGGPRGSATSSASRSPAELPLPKSFSLRAAAAPSPTRPRDALFSSQNESGEAAPSPSADISLSQDVALRRALRLGGGAGDGSGPASAALLLALTEEVQMLREQLDVQRTIYEHERGKRLAEHESERRQTVEQTRRLLGTIQHLETLHEVCLRDLVQYRHRAEKELRDCHGQVDWLKQHMQEALLLAERKSRRSAGAAVASEQRVMDRVNPFVVGLRHEHAKLKAQLKEERQQHAARVSALDQAVQDAKTTLAHERTRRRREEERHKLEMEGVRSELDLMRHALRQMEKRVYFTGSRLDVAATEEQKMTDDYFY